MNYVIHSWDTERVIVLISSPYNGGHRLHLLSLRFQTAAQRRVPQFPSTASQLPAVLCALVHVYYSSSVHFSYIFNKTSEDDINIKPKHSSRKTSALLYSITLYYYHQSGQQDLNLRPHGPQPCALPSYAIPRNKYKYNKSIL